MKRNLIRTIAAQLVFLLLLTQASFAQSQGKVVINEYMAWPGSSCGTTAEFVELLNFGPGPVNIGCYILTTGVYSVTIPANTILQPGQFYVIAGQNSIPGTCANIDSGATGIKVNLNWNTCNCTNVAIPQTGDGMMKDGGSSNTPLVLLDPSLKIIDAIVRNTPTEPVGQVTSAVSGTCGSQTFNIGTMNPNYEVLGMAAGRGNSFARTLDGDCNWLKDPQQSGNASNNRPGRVTDISYDFDMVNPTSCDERKGSVNIYVKHSDYAAIFPMSYTIVRDVDDNGIYDFNDEYTTFVDEEPPFIEIENLPVGRFRVTVASLKGCYLRSFDFPVIPCEPTTLPVRLVYFRNAGGEQHQLEWLLQDVQNLRSVVVEKGNRDGIFVRDRVLTNNGERGTKLFSAPAAANPDYPLYRLKIVQRNGAAFYSNVVRLQETALPEPVRIGPNPATYQLDVQLTGMDGKAVAYSIIGINGAIAGRGTLQVHGNKATVTVPLHNIRPGTYQLQLAGVGNGGQPISLRFVKH